MTLNTTNTILYIATLTAIYSMDTSTFITTTFASPFGYLNSIRFDTSTLYVTDYYSYLYTLNSSGTIIRTISVIANISGCAIDTNGDWYVSNPPLNSGFSLVNDDDTLTNISTNIAASNQLNVIAFDDTDTAYYLRWNYSGIFQSSPSFCFNEGTKILCMNHNLQDEYTSIELLKIGDFVKTYKHGYRKVSKVITGKLRNNPKKWNMCMYKMVKTPTNGLMEDLIVTGGHSLLVDEISDTEQAKYDEMGLTEFSKTSIDNKKLLLSSVSDHFTPMQDREIYTYYHLLLENNDDDEERFGIYANGVLTETPNVKTVK